MSHEIIIIDSLMSNPDATASDKERLQAIRERIVKNGHCSQKDATTAATIFKRLLLQYEH